MLTNGRRRVKTNYYLQLPAISIEAPCSPVKTGSLIRSAKRCRGSSWCGKNTYSFDRPLLTFISAVVIALDMELGTIVEYIDRKEVFCAVVLEQKSQKVRMLTQNNREVSHSERRLVNVGNERLDLKIGRNALVESLQDIAGRRRHLHQQIDVEELWDVLHNEFTWVDVQTMTEFCFDGEISGDHTSAVIRAMLEDRLYFKFDNNRFSPNSPEKVAQIAAQAAEEARKALVIEEGSRWLRQAVKAEHTSVPPDKEGIVDILKSFYLFGKDSPHHKAGREIVSRSEVDPGEGLFNLLVQLGVWDEDENLNLHRFGITGDFPPPVLDASSHLVSKSQPPTPQKDRVDLTHLSTLTIDGQGTLDFDDAISIEPIDEGHRLWIHVTDVGHFLTKGDPLDEEALARASSIYMPDARIPMLPHDLAENLCSLKKGKDRFAISIMADLDDSANVVDYKILPSVIRVERQLTYYNANQLVREDPQLALVHDLAQKLRKNRLSVGALQLDLPEMNVWIDGEGKISVTQINRESPGRLMVSECMILANWLAARFLRHHGQAAVFRSQLPPRERIIGQNGGTLHQNWMQRRFLSRAILSLEPEPHAGIGLDAYATLTSPLRKYLDLVTQRQLRALLGLEETYSEQELSFIIQAVKESLSYIMVLQQERTRYWILRYLEDFVGEPQEAIVVEKRRKKCVLLLTGYMLESSIPLNLCPDLEPEDSIMVKIERLDPRAGTIMVSLA
jgi:exoribonuclease-2